MLLNLPKISLQTNYRPPRSQLRKIIRLCCKSGVKYLKLQQRLSCQTEAPMSDDDPQSCPSDPTRRKFLVTTGSSVAASLVAAYVPALANSAAGESDSGSAGAG